MSSQPTGAPTPKPAAPRPWPRRKGPSPLIVITGTLGLFLVVLTLLAFQVRAGKDPSLSASPTASSTSASSGTSSATAATKSATKNAVTKSS